MIQRYCLVLCFCLLLTIGCATAPDAVFEVPESAESIVPIETVKYFTMGDAIFIKGKVNDFPDELTLAVSNSNGTTLFLDTTDRLGLQRTRLDYPVRRKSDQNSAYVIRSVSIHAGIITESFDNFYVSVGKSFLLPMGINYDGVLGSDVFEHYTITVDPAKKELRFYAHDSGQIEAEAKLPRAILMDAGLRVGEDPVFKVKALLNNSVSSDFVFDTSMIYRPIMTIETARKYGFAKNSPKTMKSHYIGENGQLETNYLFRIDSFRFGSYEMGSTLFTVAENVSANMVKMRVMKNFRITMDCQRNKIVLVPLVKRPKPNPKFSWGIEFREMENKIVALVVAENSPAANAGIQPDDEILTFNGTPAMEMGVYQILEQDINPAIKKVTLQVRSADGTVRTVKLKKRDLLPLRP